MNNKIGIDPTTLFFDDPRYNLSFIFLHDPLMVNEMLSLSTEYNRLMKILSLFIYLSLRNIKIFKLYWRRLPFCKYIRAGQAPASLQPVRSERSCFSPAKLIRFSIVNVGDYYYLFLHPHFMQRVNDEQIDWNRSNNIVSWWSSIQYLICFPTWSIDGSKGLERPRSPLN